METKKETLFDKLYEATKEVIKSLKKPLLERALKRKFEAAYDSAVDQKQNAELKLHDLRLNLENYDINAINEQKEVMRAADFTMGCVKDEYKEMFGEDMKN